MINFNIHTDIFRLDDLNLESNIFALSQRDKEKIKSVNLFQVKEQAYFQRDIVQFFRNFLVFCMEEHNIYFVFIEDYPQPKSRIRSKKGLFYTHKEKLEKNTVFETEMEVAPGETLMAGIIRLTSKNMDYVFGKLEKLPFAFGYLVPKGNKPFRISRKNFLETMVSQGLKHGKVFWKNWPKIAAYLVNPDKKLFYLQDLNDAEYFRVFYRKENKNWEYQLKRFVSNELQNSPMLQN